MFKNSTNSYDELKLGIMGLNDDYHATRNFAIFSAQIAGWSDDLDVGNVFFKFQKLTKPFNKYTNLANESHF